MREKYGTQNPDLKDTDTQNNFIQNEGVIRKQFVSSEKMFDDGEMTITHYISTLTPDRYCDIVNPHGINDRNYRKNPVVLFSHNSENLVIGKNLKLKVDEFGVLATTKFADTELGRDLYKLNKEGFLNAWSIGFIPLQQVSKKHEDGRTYNHIEEWELLEYSSVPVPANPDCLNVMMKSVTDDYLRRTFGMIKLQKDLNERFDEFDNKLKVLETKTAIIFTDLLKHLNQKERI